MCILSDFSCDGNRDCCNGADPIAWPGADNNTCADTTDENQCPGMSPFLLAPTFLDLVDPIFIHFIYLSSGCDTEEIVWRFSKANNGSGKVWQCKESGECIDQDMVCDNQEHCVDGSDEKDCCKYFGCFQGDPLSSLLHLAFHLLIYLNSVVWTTKAL